SILSNSRPRLSKYLKLIVTHTAQESGLLPSEFLLRSGYPFHSEAKIEPWVAALAGSCNGNFTLREIYQELKRQEVISSEMAENEVAGVLRLLISAGFVDTVDFALPERS